MSLGHPTNQDPQTFESQQFGPVPYGIPGYFSQPAMYASGASVAWWNEYKGWPRYDHYHNGLDVAGPQGFPLRALETGVIRYKGWGYEPGTSTPNGGGWVITVEVNPDCFFTLNHNSGFPPGLSIGQRVAKGQIIAFIGSSGTATGNHCHVSLDIDERGPDGITRRLMWNPKLFMAGGALANDPRVRPVAPPPPPAPKPTLTVGGLPVSYIPRPGWKATLIKGKPRRRGASLSSPSIPPSSRDEPVWCYYEVDGQPFPENGGDRWFMVEQYYDGRWWHIYPPLVDLKLRNFK